MAGRIIQGYFPGRTGLPDLRALAPRTTLPMPPRPVLQPHGGKGNTSVDIDPTRIGLLNGCGTPLPAPLLAKMEGAFGTDFSAVRVHIGPQAQRIGALAFAMGNNLYFAAGQFQPNTLRGQQLIGHELAHVVQQRQGRVRAAGSGVAVVQNPALEAEADRLGMRAAAWTAPIQRAVLPGLRAPAMPAIGKVAQAMKRGRHDDNAYSKLTDFDDQASDSESEAEDETRKLSVPTAKRQKTFHSVVFNHTKKQGIRMVKGKRLTKRDPKSKTTPKRRLVPRIDNHVYKGKFPSLSADATQIHHVIPATVGGKPNQSYGATTVVCALILDENKKYRKYCFTNLDRTVGSEMAAMANSLGYHVVVAPKAHAEAEMIQYTHVYKHRKLVAIGCDKEHCQECNHLMSRQYTWINTDLKTSDNIFQKYNWNPILTSATGMADRPSKTLPWTSKSGHRTDRGHYDPSPEQLVAIAGKTLVRIAPDGDCLYAAIIQARKLTTVSKLRNDLAAKVLSNAIDVRGWGNPATIAAAIKVMGSYNNVVGDYAPELLATHLNIQIRIILENGNPLDVGTPGQPRVTLLRVTFPLAHYHLVT